MDSPGKRTDTRWMLRADFKEVLQIEKDSYPNPWDEEELSNYLRANNSVGRSLIYRPSPTESGVVIGYVVYSLFRDTVVIRNLTIHEDFREFGMGTKLVEEIKRRRGRRNMVTVSVSERNLEAQLFFRSVGFFCTNIEKNSFSDTDSDAYVMEFRAKKLERI